VKLTKAETKLHEKAVELIYSFDTGRHRFAQVDCPACSGHQDGCGHCTDGKVSVDDFIFTHYQPGAEHNIGANGTFFTPPSYAGSVAWAHGNCPKGSRVLEPTAGIGACASAMLNYRMHDTEALHITCVELNPKFVEIGKRLLPECDWIRGSIFDVIENLGRFHSAIGNPPFGRVAGINGIAHAEICSLLTKHLDSGAILLLPDLFRAQHDGTPESSEYRRWKERHPLWSISETAFTSPPPGAFKGCNIKTAICDMTLI
jgi:hypothetical protein